MNYWKFIPQSERPERLLLVLDDAKQAVAVQTLFDPHHVRVVMVGGNTRDTAFDRMIVSDGAMRYVEGKRGAAQQVLTIWLNNEAQRAGNNVVFL